MCITCPVSRTVHNNGAKAKRALLGWSYVFTRLGGEPIITHPISNGNGLVSALLDKFMTIRIPKRIHGQHQKCLLRLLICATWKQAVLYRWQEHRQRGHFNRQQKIGEKWTSNTRTHTTRYVHIKGTDDLTTSLSFQKVQCPLFLPLFCGLSRCPTQWWLVNSWGMIGFPKGRRVLHTHHGEERWRGIRGRWWGLLAAFPGHGVLTLKLWYDGQQSVFWWHGCRLCHGCGWSEILASLHPPATASGGSSARAGSRVVDLIGGFLLLLLTFCSHARMRAMVSCSRSHICWVVLAAVAKLSRISGSRHLSMPSCSVLYWMPSLVEHSWLWLLIKTWRHIHVPASDWPPSAYNVLCPWRQAAWRGGAQWHQMSGHCVRGAYSLPGWCRVLGLNLHHIKGHHDAAMWSIPVLALSMQLKQGLPIPITDMGRQAGSEGSLGKAAAVALQTLRAAFLSWAGAIVAFSMERYKSCKRDQQKDTGMV